MAVQAQQCLSHAFLPHELGQAFRSLDGGAVGGGMWFDELGGGGGCAGGIGDAVFGQPRSEVTCNGNDVAPFLTRKRARVETPAPPVGLMEVGQQGLALPLAVQQGQMFAGDVLQSRAVGCGAASTSGRSSASNGASLAQGVLSQLYHQGAEVDALVRLEMERMRLGLQEARQRHLRAVVAAVERAAAGRLRAAESELERTRHRNAELEERLRQLTAEGQAWLSVAKSHEAVAAGLRATLDQLLLQQHNVRAGVLTNADGADAEDAQSCCFEAATAAAGLADDAASGKGAHQSCKSCGAADACVLLLPCRHLCLCRACEPAADACPVCAATKNASLHVLLS